MGLADLRYAGRSLARSPAFALTAICSLAIAIGGVATIFSIVDAAMLRPLPVAHAERLVRLTHPGISADGVTPAAERFTFSYPVFQRFRDVARDTARLAAFSVPDRADARLGASEAIEPVTVQFLSGDAFDLLGIGAARGRVLTRDDDRTPGQHPVAVLGHQFWRSRFGADPAVVGRLVWIGDAPYTVVGIARDGFFGIEPGKFVDLWLPAAMFEPRALANEGWNWAQVIGVLATGATRAKLQARLQPSFHDAQVEIVRRAATMPRAISDQFLAASVRVSDAVAGPSGFRERFGRPLWIVFGIAAILLVIACANLVSLFLARAAERGAETALRLSLGATRLRVVRQLLAESLIITAAAGILGWLVAEGAAPMLVASVSSETDPLRLALESNARVFGFTLLLSALVAMTCGSIPGWRASALAPASALGGHGRHTIGQLRLGRGLVVLQVAFSTCLVAGVTVFAATVWHLARVDLGLNPDNLVVLKMTGRVDRPTSDAAPLRGQLLRSQLAQQPGIESVALAAEWAPFEGTGWMEQVLRPGEPPPAREEIFYPISAGYFATLQTPVREGRDFDDLDGRAGDTAPAIVNEALVNAYFPGRSPIGQVFRHPSSTVPRVIVGVVADAHFTSARVGAEPIVYVPLTTAGAFTLYVRTALPAAAIVRLVEAQADAAGGRVRSVTTLQTLVARTMYRERLLAGVGSAFAAVGLLLSLVGIFGLLSYSVGRRTRELGIRAALGARPARLVRGVVTDATLTAGSGVILGLAAATGLVQFVRAWLFGVSVTDPLVLGAVAAIFMVGAAAAAAVPACRAASADPRIALSRHG